MKEDIKKCCEVLRSGGTILYPTDTIWGIGCDATNAEAIDKVFKLKHRDGNIPLLVLVNSVAMLERYVVDMPQVAYDLIDCATSPMTIIFDKARNLPENLVGKDGSIGIRVTNEPFTDQLIQQFRKPIVSTSANVHGAPTAQFFQEIDTQIINAVDFVVKYRQNDTKKARASQIIKLSNNGQITIIRK